MISALFKTELPQPKVATKTIAAFYSPILERITSSKPELYEAKIGVLLNRFRDACFDRKGNFLTPKDSFQQDPHYSMLQELAAPLTPNSKGSLFNLLYGDLGTNPRKTYGDKTSPYCEQGGLKHDFGTLNETSLWIRDGYVLEMIEEHAQMLLKRPEKQPIPALRVV